MSDGPLPAPVILAPYDASWPRRFDTERVLLERALEPWLIGPIEHVGSTAVPGLDAKPVVDIMAAVDNLNTSRAAIPVLQELDYTYFPYRAGIMHWFCKPSPEFRTHHLHLVPYRNQHWVERLAFRDHLRRDPDAAQEYAELKKQLVRVYPFDREAYTEAKTAFVGRIVESLLTWQK